MNKLWPLLLITFIISCNKPKTMIVEIESGKLKGSIDYENQVAKFLGIPYAQAPIGDLRWKPPVKAKKWDGIKKADTYGNIAMQYKFADWVQFDENRINEDCLYLNVWTPTNKRKEKLPVLVQIHGGGFSVGEGSETRLEGTSMAKEGIIVVTLNFRLNIFGFLAHPDLTEESPNQASGNYGLMDQQFAVKWVKENIEAFGGDPNRILVAGESAGSMSVLNMMISPLSKDLIAGGIGSSGGASQLLPRDIAENSVFEALKKAGYASIDEFRNASTDEVMEFYKKHMYLPFGPILDGYVLPKDANDAYKAGEFADVPLIIGWNSAELAQEAYLQQSIYTSEQFEKVTRQYFGDKAETVLAAYPHNTEEEVIYSATRLASLGFIELEAWNWFDLHRNYSSKPVYRYLFSKIHPPAKGTDLSNYTPPIGSRHAEEIPYSFGNLALIDDYDFSEDDYQISKWKQSYLVNFIKTGNPNSDGLLEWSAAEKGKPVQVLNFDTQLSVFKPDHEDQYPMMLEFRKGM